MTGIPAGFRLEFPPAEPWYTPPPRLVPVAPGTDLVPWEDGLAGADLGYALALDAAMTPRPGWRHALRRVELTRPSIRTAEAAVIAARWRDVTRDLVKFVEAVTVTFAEALTAAARKLAELANGKFRAAFTRPDIFALPASARHRALAVATGTEPVETYTIDGEVLHITAAPRRRGWSARQYRADRRRYARERRAAVRGQR